MDLTPETIKRRRRLEAQSGQAVLMGVLAIFLLILSIFAGLTYIGPKATLGLQQAGPYQFETVQKGLRAFVAKNGRLPCPADGTIAQGQQNEGREALTGTGASATCTISSSRGVVPWQTIGIGRTDSLDKFGYRIGYAVTQAESSPAQAQSPLNWDNGVDAVQIDTCTTACGSGGGTATKAAYALISFGTDHAGAYLPSGSRVPPPAAADVEFNNTTDAAFSGGPKGNSASNAFQVWPYRTDSSAGNNYFGDIITYETGSQINVDIGNQPPPGDPKKGQSTGSSPFNNNLNKPALAAQNSDAGALGASSGTITNVYSCASGSTYCPGSSNAGSLSNVYAFLGSNCNGNDCTAPGNGECLDLVDSLGTVCVHDPVYGSGILVGNTTQNGDWVGPNHPNSCPQCSVPGTANYMVPTQTLTFDLTSSYKSWAFVNYLVDGGMQVQIDGYQAGAWPITGSVSTGSAVITNVTPTTNLSVGQSIVGTTYFPNYTVITAIAGNQITVSQPAQGTSANASLVAMDSGFNISGTVTANSAEIDNIAVQTNSPVTIATAMNGLAVGDRVYGPGIPVGAVITAVSSAGLSMTLSSVAYANESPANLFATPWVKIGTSIVSNGSDTNILSGTQISGVTTSGSVAMSNVSPAAPLAVGQLIAGPGIQPGTIIDGISTTATGTTLALSLAATTSTAGYFLVATNDLITAPVTGNLTAGSNVITNVSSTVGITSGQAISGVGIPTGTTVSGVTGTTLTISANATTTGSSVSLFFATRAPVTGITGDFASGSTLINNVSNTSGIVVNDHIDSQSLPSGAYVTGIASSTSLSMSVAATSSQTGAPISVESLSPGILLTGSLTMGSSAVTNLTSTSGLSPTAGLLPGEIIAATGLPSGTYITSIVSSSTLSISQPATATVGAASLVVVKGTPVVATVGNVTFHSLAVTNVSPSTALSTGEFVTNVNLQDGTSITAAASGALSLSQEAIGTQTAAALTGGYLPQVWSVLMPATTTAGSTSVTVPAAVQPGLGASLWGPGIPVNTMVTGIAGTALRLSQSATLSQTNYLHFNYPMCPGPQTPNGLYHAPSDERGTTTQLAPIVQHPWAHVAAQIPSQIWPQPGTAGSGTNSANSNPNALSGNYVDQRDNQFSSIQFNDSLGNPIDFNVLVFQVLPYVYTNGQSCTISGGVNTCNYGLLFEGAKVCYTDVYSSRCTMQGSDEWWNPPVQVTMDCGQYGQ